MVAAAVRVSAWSATWRIRAASAVEVLASEEGTAVGAGPHAGGAWVDHGRHGAHGSPRCLSFGCRPSSAPSPGRPRQRRYLRPLRQPAPPPRRRRCEARPALRSNCIVERVIHGMHARRVLWSVADRSGFTHEAERRGARLVIADGRAVEVDFTRWSTGARCPTIGSRGSPSPEYQRLAASSPGSPHQRAVPICGVVRASSDGALSLRYPTMPPARSSPRSDIDG